MSDRLLGVLSRCVVLDSVCILNRAVSWRLIHNFSIQFRNTLRHRSNFDWAPTGSLRCVPALQTPKPDDKCIRFTSLRT